MDHYHLHRLVIQESFRKAVLLTLMFDRKDHPLSGTGNITSRLKISMNCDITQKFFRTKILMFDIKDHLHNIFIIFRSFHLKPCGFPKLMKQKINFFKDKEKSYRLPSITIKSKNTNKRTTHQGMKETKPLEKIKKTKNKS